MLIDLDMPASGQPAIAWPKGAFPHRPVFAAVIPPGGTEEDMRLFAVCAPWRERIDMAPFHEGPRPEVLPVSGFALEAVDPESVRRLLERGEHPGDLIVMGGTTDRYGRPEIAVLTFFDLSDGFTHDHKLSTPPETRLGLAMACGSIGTPEWAAAADQFDPIGMMRNGTPAPMGGNPMTQEGFHRYMLEKAEAGMVAGEHHMKDFRSLTTDELHREIAGDAKATVYGNPDMRKGSPGHRMLSEAIPAFADAFREGRADAGELLAEIRRLEDGCNGGTDDPAMSRLVRGIGAGVNCHRNLLRPNGLLDTAWDRMRHPGIHDDIIASVRALPDWTRRGFRDPDGIRRSTLKRLSHAKGALNDQHRPFLALPARRIAAAPGLRDAVARLGDARLATLLEGTETLLNAFDGIPNACDLAGEARDALAVGWQVLASETLRRRPEEAESLAGRDPGLPEAAKGLSYMPTLEKGARLNVTVR